MERITLYHDDVPVTHHPLLKDSFSIGSGPDNDLVLAGDRVSEHHMVIFRGADGTWRARSSLGGGTAGKPLRPDSRIAFDGVSLAIENMMTRPNGSLSPAEPELGIVGGSPQIQRLKFNIRSVAPLRAPVLVTGETGTGKELVSRGIHLASPRGAGPFVVVNCGGLTDTLMEDTLFGHRRGAFTGASGDQKGVFEQASGGTLFLDEVGEMPLSQQAALLRVLDDRRVKRIGDDTYKEADFRLVTATNRDLSLLVEQGAFRADLYHRIAAFTLVTVPLRDRPSDIPPLAAYFLGRMRDEVGYRLLDNAAEGQLAAYDWPGNVRELRNVLYRAAAFSQGEWIQKGDILFENRPIKVRRKHFRLAEFATCEIKSALAKHGGNVTAAARTLGVPRTSLRDRINRITV